MTDNVFRSPYRILSYILTIILAAALCACEDEYLASDDSELSKFEQADLLRMLDDGEISATYRRCNLHRFYADSPDDKLSEIDLSVLYGGWSTLPEEISVIDGKGWLPYVLFYEYGPVPIDEAWWCYRMATHQEDLQLYLPAPIKLSEKSDSMIMGTYKFRILKQTTNGFRIAWQTDMSREGYYEVEIADYILTKEGEEARNLMMCFPSEYDMFIDLLDRFRQKFGDAVDANLYNTGIRYTQPKFIYFDELEEILLAPYRE